MCAAAVAAVGISRVVFGCRNDKFGGCGTVLDVPGLRGSEQAFAITSGVLASEAIQLLQLFYSKGNKRTAPATTTAS